MDSMDTRNIAAEYRLSLWAERIQARMRSGQSIKAFCETEGLTRNTYFYGQRKLRAVACVDLPMQSSRLCGAIVPQGRAQLEPAKAEKAEAPLAIEIDGFRVLASDGVNLELLGGICRTLKTYDSF